MIYDHSLEREARRSLQRLLPRVEQTLKKEISKDKQGWKQFNTRLQKNFPALFNLYFEIYNNRYDFFYHLEDLLISIARSWFNRPFDLRELDDVREKNPLWFQSNQMLGGVCYVDLFANDLEGVKSKIPYFKELGLTYLHLMPLFKAPEGENDGGYAVSSYRDVHPPLGTMEQLASLACEFRRAGISLVVDLVFNHTSDEHLWAERAKAGDDEYMRTSIASFPNRQLPRPLRAESQGNIPRRTRWSIYLFLRIVQRRHWVWTTFHSYQWDLNYANPPSSTAWQKKCSSSPIKAWKCCASMRWLLFGSSSAPAVRTCRRRIHSSKRSMPWRVLHHLPSSFKSEAIVHPDDVVKYISPRNARFPTTRS
jgi:amylosucrase